MNRVHRKEGQSRLNILKIYSKINWSYWKSILNQSKYLGFPKILSNFSFLSQVCLLCNSNWMIVFKYFQNISAGLAFFPTIMMNYEIHWEKCFYWISCKIRKKHFHLNLFFCKNVKLIVSSKVQSQYSTFLVLV